MNLKEVKKEGENLSVEDSNLKLWLKQLPRVQAPADFDFRLKARLAQSASNHQTFGFMRALRYAVPVLAVALAVGLIVFGGRFWLSNELIAEVPAPIEENSAPANLSVAAVSPTPVTEDRQTPERIVETPSVPKNETAHTAPKDAGRPEKLSDKPDKDILTRDFSVKPPEVKQPDNNKRNIRRPQSFENTTPIPLESVLVNIGIKAVLENGKWTVKSVSPNSLAERSGIQNADVLESLDETVLQPDTAFKKSAEGKTITVSRDGNKKVIVLQNK